MYRPTPSFANVSVASLAAGPIFVTALSAAYLYGMVPHAVSVSLQPEILVAMVPASVLICGFGFIVSVLPNLLGSGAMIMASQRSEMMRLPAAWMLVGCAFPLLLGVACDWPGEVNFALAFTGGSCAAICRRGACY